MSFLQKLKKFVTHCGAPAKFVAKTIIGYAVPGSGPVLELIDKLIDCAHETVKDNLDSVASREDLQRLEKMFDLMLGEMQGLVEKLKGIEHVPDIARKTLLAALRSEKQWLAAKEAMNEQYKQLSAVQRELRRLSAGMEDLVDLQFRLYSMELDFIKEYRADNAVILEKLNRIEEGIGAVRGGKPEQAEAIFTELSREQPASAVLAVAVAASQAAGHNFVGAAKALASASRLRPGDVKLAEMSRIATKYSQRATPIEPRPDAKKRPRPGDTLDGWLLEKLIGFGGWGQVFLARKGDHLRALKIMHAELSQDAEFVKRFKREMSLLTNLGRHAHLVHIDPDHLFDKADDWNCWYYVMEYVEGITLERYLEKRGPLTLDQVRGLFTGIAKGLATAHARGIIHRDIKPANILIRKKPEAGQGQGVLVDFGLAGLVDPHSRGAGYTALFAAPEQMRHGSSDCRSDIYSLAATIYYCLLYNDADKRGRFKAKLLPADTPTTVRTLLARCLDNDPDERPRDAGAFVQDWCQRTKVDNITSTQIESESITSQSPNIFTNSLGMQFVFAPAATFWMGFRDEQRQVQIPHDFYMGIHPVTQAQWQALMGNNPSWFSRTDKGADQVRGISDTDLKQFPVEQVSWEDVQQFIEKLNACERKGEWTYRLPTETEWEYVCRGGVTSQTECAFDFYFDQPTNDASSYQANFNGNFPAGDAEKGPNLRRPTKVGSYKGNKLGVFDMLGNVWEWCDDVCGHGGSKRVIRGGGWNGHGKNCRAHSNYSGEPQGRNQTVGFRLARVPAQERLSRLAHESLSPTPKRPEVSPKLPPDPTPSEATSLPLVTNREEIEKNVKLFDNYLSGDSTEREFARQQLVRGKCFVVLREGGRSYFAPSKFVGYTNDSRAKYEAHVNYLDGRTTNNAINSVLQQDCSVDEDANQEFRSYCEQAGMPVTIGNHRRFWRIEK